jgi:hypothetical protein
VPKLVETSHGTKAAILRNQQGQADSTIINNKSDILIPANEEEACMLIDVTMLRDRNAIKKEAEKIIKYKDFTIDIQLMWYVTTKVIAIITEAIAKTSESV